MVFFNFLPKLTIVSGSSLEELVVYCAVSLCLYVFLFWWWATSKEQTFLRKFSGPRNFPVVGCAFDLIWNTGPDKDIIKVFYDYPKKYGLRFSLSIGWDHFFTSMHPVDIEKLLTSSTNLDKSTVYDYVRGWLGDSLLVCKGEKWHKRRKLLNPSFHFKILEEFQIIFDKQSKIFVNMLSRDHANDDESTSFDICPYITTCALDIICETAMGVSIDSQSNHDSPYLKAITRLTTLSQIRGLKPWLSLDFVWSCTTIGEEEARLTKILHDCTDKVIQERKAEVLQSSQQFNQDRTDSCTKARKVIALLDLLLSAQRDGELGLTDLEIRNETSTFMFAGHDTSASSLSFCAWLLASHPEDQNKVIKELDDIFGTDKERPVTSQDLSRMKFMECCIKETLRLYPSIPFVARKLSTDLTLDDGTVVPAGINYFLLSWYVHRNPQIYSNADKFMPERFFPENSVHRSPFAYIPFLNGPRNCIGQKFAMMEEKTVLANLLRHFRLKTRQKEEDIKLKSHVVLCPENGIFVSLQRRR